MTMSLLATLAGGLGLFMHTLERGLSARDDFSYHDVIDQFKTGSVRYLLYDVVDVLSMYPCHCAPGFASQNCIEKSLQEPSSLFEMVTGYLRSAIGLYEQAFGNPQYHRKNAWNL
ncbi:hypothetical protein B0J13DRAFT_625220 [Dactylonectria estremocensis]|uniref:Uncharacterized protein n=1 Tax=Dactylonectria estremocensis TaxID=1079267 RepID=A0A9P9IXK4_9HYPO|nr:hypothetical protein B0J13DRAFT_625220 [Dactylonectria estremocensis]